MPNVTLKAYFNSYTAGRGSYTFDYLPERLIEDDRAIFDPTYNPEIEWLKYKDEALVSINQSESANSSGKTELTFEAEASERGWEFDTRNWTVFLNGEISVGGAELSGEYDLDFGAGNDRVVVEPEATANIVINFGAGNDTLDAREQWDEELGAHRLHGPGGHITAHGGSGNDTFVGGWGVNKFYGGSGNDTASYAASEQGVFIDLNGSGDAKGSVWSHIYSNGMPATMDWYIYEAFFRLIKQDPSLADYYSLKNGYMFGGDANYDTLDSIENLTGSNYGDWLVGNKKAYELKGLDGDDVIDGEKGHDTLYGGGGNDVILGGSGNDVLYAGAGVDVLFGGSGADTFVITHNDTGGVISYPPGRNVELQDVGIMDFKMGVDKIDLSEFLRDGRTVTQEDVDFYSTGTMIFGDIQAGDNNEIRFSVAFSEGYARDFSWDDFIFG